jgi:hypothetical protein
MPARTFPRSADAAENNDAFANDGPSNPVVGFAKDAAFLLLLGEKAGMREDVKRLSLGNGFWRDAENGNQDGRAPHSNVAASRQSAANVTGNLDGGFLPKAATLKLGGDALW